MNRATGAAALAVCLVSALAEAAQNGAPRQPAASPATAARSISTVSSGYTVDVWTVDEGLPQGQVSAILRARDGYLWIGTWGGVARFDGVRFTPVPVPNNAVTGLHEDRDGNVWITSDGGGVVRWRQGQIRSFTEADGLSHNNAVTVGEDAAGNIWVGTMSGLSVIANDRVTVRRPAPDRPIDLINVIKFVGRGPSGRLWIGTAGGVCEARNLDVACRHLPVAEPGGWVEAVHEDREGGVWLGTDRSGLVHVRETQTTVFTTCASGPRCLPAANIGAIHETASGDLWVGFRGSGGLVRLRGDSMTAFGPEQGIPPNAVETIVEDPEGSLWVGTLGGGLVRLRPKRTTVYTRDDGLASDVVQGLAADAEGHVWAAANCGPVSRLEHGRFQVILREYFTKSCSWSLLRGRDGSMWIGTSLGGLYRWHNGTMSHWHTGNGLSDDSVLALHEDSKGGLWIGTDLGDLHYLRDGVFTNYSARDGLQTGNASAITEDRQGRIWVAFNGTGLWVFAGGRFTHIGTDSGLTTKLVSKLYVDRAGNLWVGTWDQGLFRLKGDRFIRHGREHGLLDDALSQILEDHDGNLWIGTNHGISRFSRQELDDFADGRITLLNAINLGREDGMLSPEATGSRFHPAGLRTDDGRLWFSTMHGLVVVDPARFPVNEIPPPVLVERARVDGRNIAHEDAGPIRVPAGTQALEVDYTAFSMLGPANMRFKYRLAGFDSDWRDAGNRRTAYYSRLPPAEYTFEVLAANNDGIWSPTPAAVRLVVAPFWWERREVQGAGLVVLLLVTGVGVRTVSLRRARARVAALEREQALARERSRIARDLHDDLGSRLSHIALVAEASSGDGDGRVSHAAREALQTMDELVWAVNARNDTVESFAYYVAQFAEEHLRAAGLRCRLRIQPELPTCELGADVRRHMYLAFKEAVTNAVKHAQATEVRVSLAVEDQALVLDVADDGRGLPSETLDLTGNGLKNMRERMAAAGGTLEIDSASGRGTRVTFRTPLP